MSQSDGDGGDAESNGGFSVDRRTVLKVAGGAVAAGGAAVLGMQYATEPAVAATGLTGEDVSVKSANGKLEKLTIAPTVTVKWENFGGVKAVDIRFRANGPQSNGTAIGWTRKSLDNAKSSGEVQFDMDTHGMLGKNDGPLDASSFAVGEEGGKTEKDVTVMLDIRLNDGQGNTVTVVKPAAKVTYTVTVTNQKSKVTVTGKLNTGAQCLSKNDFPEGLWENAECEITPTASETNSSA